MKALAGRAFLIDPYNVTVLRYAGDAEHMLGDDKTALIFYEQALRLLGSNEADEQVRVQWGAASAAEQLYRQNPTPTLRKAVVGYLQQFLAWSEKAPATTRSQQFEAQASKTLLELSDVKGVWTDGGGTFANRLRQTPPIDISPSRAGGYVILFEQKVSLDRSEMYYLLRGNLSRTGSHLSGQLELGLLMVFSSAEREACRVDVQLNLDVSTDFSLITGTAYFGAPQGTSQVSRPTFDLLCAALPRGSRSVRFERIQ